MNIGSLVLAIVATGCVISEEPRRSDGEISSDAVALRSAPLPGTSSCSSYCADGELYCPPNPLMECYFYCTRICLVCDGETTCYDNPLPE